MNALQPDSILGLNERAATDYVVVLSAAARCQGNRLTSYKINMRRFSICGATVIF